MGEGFGSGNVEKRPSEFAASRSGDGRSCIMGLAPPAAFNKGDLPSYGVMGEGLLESLDALTGVNWSWRIKGRSI